jgi:Hydantoinase/oxoprolinase N-terminal region
MSMSVRVGIDTGGTFTDFVQFDGAGLRVHKVRSTPADPSVAILEGLRDLGRDAALPPNAAATGRGASEIVHGSTVATNALLERKCSRPYGSESDHHQPAGTPSGDAAYHVREGRGVSARPARDPMDLTRTGWARRPAVP